MKNFIKRLTNMNNIICMMGEQSVHTLELDPRKEEGGDADEV
jgi:hypothetical protein